jgi:hypothetical protein
MSAPASSSTSTTSMWPSAAAHISAVVFWTFSAAFTSTPRVSSRRTAGTLPDRDAAINGVSPSGWAFEGFAPERRSRSTIAESPTLLACNSGVMPKSLAASTAALFAISSRAISTEPLFAAHSNGVDPSPARTLTSLPDFTSARTA